MTLPTGDLASQGIFADVPGTAGYPSTTRRQAEMVVGLLAYA